MKKTTQAKAKILVIDDEGDLSDLMEVALGEDYNIETEFDGKSALSKLEAILPNLIITGTYVSPEEGFNLMESIRKITNVPVLVISGASLRSRETYFKNKGVTALLVKPFTIQELKTKISAMLESYRKFI